MDAFVRRVGLLGLAAVSLGAVACAPEITVPASQERGAHRGLVAASFGDSVAFALGRALATAPARETLRDVMRASTAAGHKVDLPSLLSARGGIIGVAAGAALGLSAEQFATLAESRGATEILLPRRDDRLGWRVGEPLSVAAAASESQAAVIAFGASGDRREVDLNSIDVAVAVVRPRTPLATRYAAQPSGPGVAIQDEGDGELSAVQINVGPNGDTTYLDLVAAGTQLHFDTAEAGTTHARLARVPSGRMSASSVPDASGAYLLSFSIDGFPTTHPNSTDYPLVMTSRYYSESQPPQPGSTYRVNLSSTMQFGGSVTVTPPFRISNARPFEGSGQFISLNASEDWSAGQAACPLTISWTFQNRGSKASRSPTATCPGLRDVIVDWTPNLGTFTATEISIVSATRPAGATVGLVAYALNQYRWPLPGYSFTWGVSRNTTAASPWLDCTTDGVCDVRSDYTGEIEVTATTGGKVGTSRLTFTTSDLSAQIVGPSIVRMGSTCGWTVSASGGVAPYTYRWSKDGYYDPSDPSYAQTTKSFYIDDNTPLAVVVTDSRGVRAVTRFSVQPDDAAPACQ